MKKLKLLASLSMLCLSIALLCFGVFAASTVTYTISGTISYDVTDVFCNLDVAVYSCGEIANESTLKTYADAIAAKGAATSTQTNVTVGSSTTTFTYTSKTGTYRNENAAVSGIIAGSNGVLTTSTDGLKLSYTSTGSVYSFFVVIKVTNLASKPLKVTSGSVSWGTADNSYHYTSVTSTGIAKDSSANLVIAMAIKDKKVSISANNAFSIPLTLKY